MAIPFSYTTFWKWFRDDPEQVLTPAPDVFVTVYSVDLTAMKTTDTSTEAVPFLTRNMRAMRVADDDALAANFPGGLFAVMESAAFENGVGDEKARVKALRKKNLFIVFPKVVQHEGVPLVIANHYSCVIDDGGRHGTPLHFHLTEYSAQEGEFGGAVVANNYMPLHFTIPADNEAFRAMLIHERLKKLHVPKLRSVFSRPWAASQTVGGHAVRRHTAQAGGGHAARRRRRQRVVVAPDASFDDLWRTLPLSRITVMGFPSGSGFDVTVFLADRAKAQGAVRGTSRLAASGA